jgi:hypothetical protein
MTIVFAVGVTMMLLGLFVIGVAIAEVGLCAFVAMLGLFWGVFGLGMVGSIVPSGSYLTELVEIPVIEINEQSDGAFSLFLENGETIQFDKINQLLFKSAKKLVFETGRKNLYGISLDDRFDEVKSKILILKPNKP